MEAGQCMEGVPEEILQQRKPVWRYTIEEEFWGKFCFDEIYFGFVDHCVDGQDILVGEEVR